MYRGFSFGLVVGFLTGSALVSALGFCYVWLTGLI
jgi:hypothetical protein